MNKWPTQTLGFLRILSHLWLKIAMRTKKKVHSSLALHTYFFMRLHRLYASVFHPLAIQQTREQTFPLRVSYFTAPIKARFLSITSYYIIVTLWAVMVSSLHLLAEPVRNGITASTHIGTIYQPASTFHPGPRAFHTGFLGVSLLKEYGTPRTHNKENDRHETELSRTVAHQWLLGMIIPLFGQRRQIELAHLAKPFN